MKAINNGAATLLSVSFLHNSKYICFETKDKGIILSPVY
ncbi:hypothetical protein GPLA_0826 [Paraglaciecola polaris LMG 21857]|uniref:Uncharacterized protein n=1 Tax=Paraglaciecola polaris LMG 21857 TaxID=1129793 RepID=K6ZN45_9ALTE|nr:hypothetical protein GPLA_0826 [Paraglaciecola polaris LMG 21857]